MITTRQQVSLRDIEKMPKSTYTGDFPLWEPVQHKDLVRNVLDIADERGWEVSNFSAHLTGDGRGMACSFDVGRDHKPPLGCVYSLGLMHSNDKRFGMKLYGGLRIPEHRSSIVLSEYSLGKHTAHAVTRLDDQLHKAMVLYARDSRQYLKTMLRLEESRLAEIQVNDLLMTAGRARLMGGSRVIQADRLYGRSEGSAWDLLISFGVPLKKGEPIHQMSRGFLFYRMVEKTAQREAVAV